MTEIDDAAAPFLEAEIKEHQATLIRQIVAVGDREFWLPPEVRPLSEARIAVRDYYRRKGLDLEFSFDGNLVGDFGEACAVEEYGMKLVEAR
jgi:hypothetical protein